MSAGSGRDRARHREDGAMGDVGKRKLDEGTAMVRACTTSEARVGEVATGGGGDVASEVG